MKFINFVFTTGIISLLGTTTIFAQTEQRKGLTIVKPPAENDERNALVVYPNPASETITVTAKRKLNGFVVEIFDQAGKYAFAKQPWDSKPINISQLSPGIYAVRLTRGKESYVEKLIVLRQQEKH